MTTSYAEAVREGMLAAARLHQAFQTREKLSQSAGNIDVFEIAFDLGLTLLFRPLKGLLGAYLPDPLPGVLITTERPLSIQRFTGAHEVGHFFMKHQPSLDDEGILRRSLFALGPSQNFQEVEANAFAASFLMPSWLMVHHCEQQGWLGPALRNPQTIYQLSLRLGSSYEATCWALSRYKYLREDEARHFADAAPRSLKAALLRDFAPANYRADVWLLTQRDEGSVFIGSPNDLFVVRLREHSGGGYLWDFDELQRSGFAIVKDRRESGDQGIGGDVTREILAQPSQSWSGKFHMAEKRPWERDAALTELSFEVDLFGQEREGYSRAERRRLLKAA